MSASKFVYVTYIRTTPDKLWQALTSPEFTHRYWHGVRMESSFMPGSDWKLMIPDGRIADAGKVIECDPPRKLVVTWRNEFIPEMAADGESRCAFVLEQKDAVVKLTVTHESDKPESKLIAAIGTGWPTILSSLKSLLETGEPLPGTGDWPKGF